jgi:hypothetical protein
LGDFFEKISILEVEIGRNGPGILGVNHLTLVSTLNIRPLGPIFNSPPIRLLDS